MSFLGFIDISGCGKGLTKRGDPNNVYCASSAPTAEDLIQIPDLNLIADQNLMDQFNNDIPALVQDTQAAIPENAAEEVVPQADPRQEAVQTHGELRFYEPSWRSNDGSWPEDVSFAINNVTNFRPPGSASNPIIILNDPGPSQRQLLVGDPGPSSSRNYQQAGPLAGFEAPPPDQRLSGLPHHLTFLENLIELVPERYRRIPGGDARVMTFGHTGEQIGTILHQYRVNYRNGRQVFLGPELNSWLQRAAIPGLTTISLATEFEQAYHLGDTFIRRVNQASGPSFGGFTNLGPEFLNLPRYEGIAHFWEYNNPGTLRNRFTYMFNARSRLIQTWFHIDGMYRLLKSLVLT